jgi:hypothetical protein
VGAFVCLALASILLLAGCASGPVEVDSPSLQDGPARRCAGLTRALPETVAGQQRRDVDPADAFGAAWGDPPIVLRCGVGRPAGFDPTFGSCQSANGVDWYIPERQITGEPVDIAMTTIGRAANVEVRLPAEYFPPAEAMVDLAPAIKATLPSVKPCV